MEMKGRLDAVGIRKVVVVGAGQMGGGIAQVVAASGASRSPCSTRRPEAATRAVEVMQRSLAKLAAKGGPEPGDVLRCVHRVASLSEAANADLLLEAVVEDEAVKKQVFREADAALPEHAILASNTSSIPIGSLAAATNRPDRVIGMHFFNPVPVLKLVEVIRASATSDETASAIVSLARDLGKEPVEARDVAGFVSNRILMPFINEAITRSARRWPS